jgi:hypothetical protein
VILDPHLCKRNQTFMNDQQSTSISGEHNPENTKGERIISLLRDFGTTAAGEIPRPFSGGACGRG